MRSFRAKVWKYPGPAGWHFVTFPKRLSLEIRAEHHGREEGWGRLPATLRIGKTEWKTSIWFDTKLASYVAPIKAIVRKEESVAAGDIALLLVEFSPAPPKSSQKYLKFQFLASRCVG